MMPIRRTIIRYNILTVFSVLALKIALSMLLTTSNTTKPITIKIDSTSDTVEARSTWASAYKTVFNNKRLRLYEVSTKNTNCNKKVFLQ
jgi:hypothetical protein